MSRGEEGKEVKFNTRTENGLKQRWITSTRQGSRPKRMRLGGYIYLKGVRAETDEETNWAGTMLKEGREGAFTYMRNNNEGQRASECKQKLFFSRSPQGHSLVVWLSRPHCNRPNYCLMLLGSV